MVKGFPGRFHSGVCALWALGMTGVFAAPSVAGICADDNCEADIVRYREVVRKDPKNEEARQTLAGIAWELAERIERAEALERYAQADEVETQIAEHLKDIGPFTEHRAGQGDVRAQLAAGVFARRGVFEASDRDQACGFYRQAAEGVNPYGLFRYGMCVEEKRPLKALALIYRGAASGHAAAQHKLAQRVLDSRPPRTAAVIDWLQRSATQGRPSAQARLALLYLQADGGEDDPQAALGLYLEAAAGGDPAARNNLGEMYERGGAWFSQDLEAAADWYRRAAECGFAPAQFNLARLYAEGKGVEQDVCLASRWFDAAAGQGLPAAAQMLEWLDSNSFECEPRGE